MSKRIKYYIRVVGNDVGVKWSDDYPRLFERRCKQKLPKSAWLGGYWGRCDLKRNHNGECALERGMDIVLFAKAILINV